MSFVGIHQSELLPLTIVKDLQLTPRTTKRIRKLEDYDLSNITENLVDKGPAYSPEQVWPIKLHFGKADIDVARILEKEFKRFIAITLMCPGEIYAPSGPIDMYWHFLVL